VKRVMGTGQDSPQLHRASSVEEVELSGTPPPGLAPGKPDRWEGYGVSCFLVLSVRCHTVQRQLLGLKVGLHWEHLRNKNGGDVESGI
jgi:hypothetical protein